MTQSRIDKLEAKRRQIDAQLQAAKARQRTQKRKDDTRRKIISGGLALKHAERNPDSEFARIMLHLIQNGTKTPKDRALFDLDPLPSEQPETSSKPSPSPRSPSNDTPATSSMRTGWFRKK